MYSRFCRGIMWEHVLIAVVVVAHGTGLVNLFFNLQAADTLWFALEVLLAGLVSGSINYAVSIRHLRPVRGYFMQRQDGEADRAAAVLFDWPTRVIGQMLLLRLPVFMLVLFAAVYADDRWLHLGISVPELAGLLPYIPVGAAPYGILVYFFAAAGAAEALAKLAREHKLIAERARPDYRRFTRLIGLALFLVAVLPLAQVVLIAWLGMNQMDMTPKIAQQLVRARWGVLIALIFISASVYLFVWVVVAPVRWVSERMRDLADGDLDARVTLPAWGELGILTGGFNAMAESIQAQHQEIRRLHVETVRALSASVEARDPYTRGHSDRVGRLAAQMAAELGWNAAQADELMLTGFLHDVGKIGIPETVLLKEGPLSSEDWEQIRRHPVLGSQIVGQVDALAQHLFGIRHHHERLDGSGYPDGLKGEEIPQGTRVLAVADVWDAMISDRPYRPGVTPGRAMEILQEEAEANRLDWEVVRALGRVLRRG